MSHSESLKCCISPSALWEDGGQSLIWLWISNHCVQLIQAWSRGFIQVFRNQKYVQIQNDNWNEVYMSLHEAEFRCLAHNPNIANIPVSTGIFPACNQSLCLSLTNLHCMPQSPQWTPTGWNQFNYIYTAAINNTIVLWSWNWPQNSSGGINSHFKAGRYAGDSHLFTNTQSRQS